MIATTVPVPDTPNVCQTSGARIFATPQEEGMVSPAALSIDDVTGSTYERE
jgi:hypothetical protein